MRELLLVIITGYPGSGKSRVAFLLSLRYITVWISQYVTRLLRPGERDGKEKKWISHGDFMSLMQDQRILHPAITENMDGETEYLRGFPIFPDWVKVSPETEIMIVVPGAWGALELAAVARRHKIKVLTVCLVADNDILKNRIDSRPFADFQWGHMEKVREYRVDRVENYFEHVIDTSHTIAEEVARKIDVLIKEIAGLTPRM